MASEHRTPSKRVRAERRVIDTAMRDHMRLIHLGWKKDDLWGLPRTHFLACEALAKILGRKK